jgi:glycosyltransferase involved in cell wall biosynthesis
VEQQQLASKLALDPHITHLQNVPVNLLAAIYRRAAIVLLPSDSEGFGLPLAEAMACGTPVAISHIPALLEVAGDAASSYPVGDITRWSSGLLSLLEERAKNGKNWYQRSALCRRQASLFSWSTNAREIASLYQTVLAQGHYRETPCGKS